MRRIVAAISGVVVLLSGLAIAAPPASGAPLSCGATGSGFIVGDSVSVSWDLDSSNGQGSGYVEIYDPSGSKIGGWVVPQDAPLVGSRTVTVTTAGTYNVRCLAADDQLVTVGTPGSSFTVGAAPAPTPQITSCTVSVSGDQATVNWTTNPQSSGFSSFDVGVVNAKAGAAAQSVGGSDRTAIVSLAAESAGLLTVAIEPDGDDTRIYACPDFTYTPPRAQPPIVTLGEAKTNNTKRQQWLNISWSAPAIGWRSPNLSGYDATLSFATGIWVPCGWSGAFIAVAQGVPDSDPVTITAPCDPATASLTLTALNATTVQGEFSVTPDFSVVRSLKYWTLIDGNPGPFVNLAASPTDKKVTFVISNLPPGKSVKVLSLVSFFEAPFVLDPSASVNMPAAATAQLTYNPGKPGPFSKSLYVGTPLTLTPEITPAGKVATGYSLSGTLPPGLTLNLTTGVISGTPTSAGDRVSTVTVSFADGSTASQAITFSVTAPPPGTGLAYQNITVRSGDPFAVAPNTRPRGQTFAVSTAPTAPFTVSATGVVSGTAPAVTTTTSYTVTVTAANPTEKATFTVTVNPPAGVAPSGPATSTVAGSGTGTTSGSTGSGGGSSGSAGSGLSASPCLAPDGLIYTDFAGSVGSTLTMAPNLTGMRPTTGFSVVAGSLPQGMWLDSQVGVISGTPLRSNGGSGPVTVQTNFVDGSVRQTVFNIAVDDPHHAINYPNRVVGSVGEEVVVAPLDVHTHGKRTYRVVCGTLLPGLRFDTRTGEISGTPTSIVERPVPMRVRMTDDYGWVDSSFLIVVNQGITPWVRYPDYAQLDLGTRTIVDPTRSGLPGTTTYTLTGRLPKGLTFDKVTGAIYGTPRAARAKVYHPTVRAHNAQGDVVAVTQLSVAVTKSAVPMRVKARAAARSVKPGSVVLVTRIAHPSWSRVTVKVRCASCTYVFRPKTGRLVVTVAKGAKKVTVRVLAVPVGAAARAEYVRHQWVRTWRVST